jgi:hypothetical protein
LPRSQHYMLIVIGKCSIICVHFYSLAVLFAAFLNKKIKRGFGQKMFLFQKIYF